MLHIRPATIHDAALLRTMIRELADYEHELDLVTITEGVGARWIRREPAFPRTHRGVGRTTGGIRPLFWLLFDAGGARIIFGRFICATGVPKPRHWKSATGSGGSDRSRGTLLRDTLGSAGLERKSDRVVYAVGSKVSRSVASGDSCG